MVLRPDSSGAVLSISPPLGTIQATQADPTGVTGQGVQNDFDVGRLSPFSLESARAVARLIVPQVQGPINARREPSYLSRRRTMLRFFEQRAQMMGQGNGGGGAGLTYPSTATSTAAAASTTDSEQRRQASRSSLSSARYHQTLRGSSSQLQLNSANRPPSQTGIRPAYNQESSVGSTNGGACSGAASGQVRTSRRRPRTSFTSTTGADGGGDDQTSSLMMEARNDEENDGQNNVCAMNSDNVVVDDRTSPLMPYLPLLPASHQQQQQNRLLVYHHHRRRHHARHRPSTDTNDLAAELSSVPQMDILATDRANSMMASDEDPFALYMGEESVFDQRELNLVINDNRQPLMMMDEMDDEDEDDELGDEDDDNDLTNVRHLLDGQDDDEDSLQSSKVSVLHGRRGLRSSESSVVGVLLRKCKPSLAIANPTRL